MQTLKPIYDHLSYSKEIEKMIYSLLYREIFKPLLGILNPPKEKLNATTTSLEKALASGELKYEGGFFVGKLNANLSKQLRGIGAVYNKLRKAYKLEISHLPQDIKIAISQGNAKAKEQLKQVEDFLKAVEGREIEQQVFEPMYGDILGKLEKQYQSTTRKIRASDIEIPIDERLKEQIKEAYTNNLNLYIQKWHDEQILRLRQKVQKNVSAGFRSESLIRDIIQEKGVTYNKAKFLARQETSLMVAKYRQIRYEDLGVRRYMWSTSHDVRVRHDHRELNGRMFSFDNPPVTDKATGARNNPGEDYNCRCIAIPVLSYQTVEKGEIVNV